MAPSTYESELQPAQLDFLEQLAAKPDQIVDVLAECHVSPRRLAGWLGDHNFRSAYLHRCMQYEEMMFPAFVATVRHLGTSADKNAPKYAAIYMGIIKERTDHLMANATPPTPQPTGTPDDDEKRETDDQESLASLLGHEG
jgi:hypothetical protein